MNQCVVRQGAMSNGSPFQQLSNLMLDGFITVEEMQNTDSGRLYGTFTFANSTYTLDLFKDPAKLSLVASATASQLGLATVVEQNDSEITGTVNFAQYALDDPYIEVICFLSRDRELPLANLDSVSDYDPVHGLAAFHL